MSKCASYNKTQGQLFAQIPFRSPGRRKKAEPLRTLWTMLLCWILVTSIFHTANCFCGDHTNLTEAVVRVSNWLREYHANNNSTPLEPHMTSIMLVSLRLAGNRPKTLLTDYRTNTSFSVVDSLKAHLEKHQTKYSNLALIPAGQMAYIVQGTLALCLDPQDFFGHNLTKALVSSVESSDISDSNTFNLNYFQYSAVALALCQSAEYIRGPVADKSISELRRAQKALSDSETDTPDTISMVIMALSCFRRNVFEENVSEGNVFEGNVKKEVDQILKSLVDIIVPQRYEKNLWNVHSNSLVVQALMSLPPDLRPRNWHCKKLMKNILEEQDESGSFGDVLANIQVLPTLMGRSLVDLGDLSCPRDSQAQRRKNISVCVKLAFQDSSHHGPVPQVNLVVREKTTAFEILKLAAKENPAYEYETIKTSFGHMITAISNVKQDQENGLYWALYTSENSPASDGVDLFIPKNNTCVIFRYRKCNVPDNTDNDTGA